MVNLTSWTKPSLFFGSQYDLMQYCSMTFFYCAGIVTITVDAKIQSMISGIPNVCYLRRLNNHMFYSFKVHNQRTHPTHQDLKLKCLSQRMRHTPSLS